MKTKEELNALKEEVETLNKKLAELTEEELEQVTGGAKTIVEIDDQKLATGDIRDPADVQTREEALKIAELLGDGKNMGTWQTMSGEQYMQLWDSIHQNF